MRRKFAAVIVPLLVAIPLTAGATPAQAGVKSLAKQECRQERATEPAEFAAQYGGTGKAALRRCVRFERSDARRDCRGDRAEEPAEFAAQYGGTGRKAIKRCMRDELR